MFYTPMAGDHGLPFDPFKAIVAPRPIGWIASRDKDGKLNLAPYSYFNAVSTKPHIVMFSSEGIKDSVTNIEATGEFVCSLATYDLRLQMNETSASLPHGTSEFEVAGLEMAESRTVSVPRVAASSAALECKLIKTDHLNGLDGKWSGSVVVFGEVTGIYIADQAIVNGRFDMAGQRTIARCGYRDYAVVDELFEMSRPTGTPEGV
ncbi:MAG TPA: flavin reductase family protein [Afifellaceae bacterium]|nr:flavin reductase family protein [Afifellaceae bacterium]